jgi:DNA repair exonuclease SbcCD ATPase subunit
MAELAGLAPAGLPALCAEADAFRAEAAGAPGDTLDPVEARAAEEDARARDAAAQAAVAEARSSRTAAECDEIAARQTVEAAARSLEELATDAAALPSRDTLAQALDAHADAIVAAAARVAALSGGGADELATAEAALRDAKAAVRRADDRRNELERRHAELGGRIRARAEEGVEERRDQVAGRLEEAEARAARWAAEARALARLRDALAQARTEARDRYLAPVTAELAPLVGLLLGGAELRVHPNRLLPQTLVRDGGEEALAALSGGTQEQIAILTRLAFARLLARTGRPIPVILVDPLVFADETRAARMRAAL